MNWVGTSWVHQLGHGGNFHFQTHFEINLAAVAGDMGVMSPQIPYEKLPPTQQMSS